MGSFWTGALALESVSKRYFLYLGSQNHYSAKPPARICFETNLSGNGTGPYATSRIKTQPVDNLDVVRKVNPSLNLG